MVNQHDIEVRTLVDTDVGDACALLNEIIDIGGTTAFEDQITNAEFKISFLTKPSCLSCLTAIDTHGAVIGFQSLTQSESAPDNRADIAAFARHRPKVPGVGRALFDGMKTNARSLGIATIDATVRADYVPGLAYYKKMGFVEYAVASDIPLQDGTPVDRISYRYDL